MNMAFWDQTGDADGSGRGNYFSGDYDYDVEIVAVKHKGAGYRGESVIVNVTVLTSNNDECPAGMQKSVAWNLSKQPVLSLGNIKAFVCGIYGLPAGSKGEEVKAKVNHVAKRMVEADNPLAGVRVHLSTWMSKTQKGGDYTNHDWTPYVAEPGYAPPMPSAAASFAAPTNAPGPGPAGYAPPPPPPPAANPTAGWRRENGYRLNPHTNAWELDR